MRQKLKVNNDALKEKLAELYRRAAGFGPTNKYFSQKEKIMLDIC